MGSYRRFGAMIATSTAVMFGLMYLNTLEPGHVFFSETRTFMALIMGAARPGSLAAERPARLVMPKAVKRAVSWRLVPKKAVSVGLAPG